jgi:hypothetical protein
VLELGLAFSQHGISGRFIISDSLAHSVLYSIMEFSELRSRGRLTLSWPLPLPLFGLAARYCESRAKFVWAQFSGQFVFCFF